MRWGDDNAVMMAIILDLQFKAEVRLAIHWEIVVKNTTDQTRKKDVRDQHL